MSKRSHSEDVEPDAEGSPHPSKRASVVKSRSQGTYVENDSEDDGHVSDSMIEKAMMVANRPSKSLVPKGPVANQGMAGLILRISMNNFMCHNHLEVVLGKHVNFIVGRNGSGKSAVVTALVVGLGGKAAATNRGHSIKHFVKTGKRRAWVEVVLSNKGKDSYKHNLYGDKIIVKRKFSAEGASSYSISSEKGQFISGRRDELTRILDHLNIQVGNPIAILNQDTSRNFLNTTSASDKFKFFMKATQLEQMTQDYDQVRRDKEKTKQIINEKEQTLPTMQAEVKDWETKLKNMAAISELKKKVKDLKKEMAWAIVTQKEMGLRPTVKSLHMEETALPKFIKKVEEAKKRLMDSEARHKEVEERLIGCSNEVKDLEPLLLEKKRAVQQAKEKLTPVVGQLRSCDRELATAKRECRQCENRIEELRTTASSHDYEAERRQREEQIQALEAKKEGLVSKQKVAEHELDQYRSAVAKYKADLAALESTLKLKENRMQTAQSNLNTLQFARSDRLLRYGTWVPAVLERIRSRRNEFHHLPKGPLGSCFELMDSKWALAVEMCLKNLVLSFICHDHHDEKLLLSIFQHSCPPGIRPTIITSLFSTRVHPIQSTRVQSDRFPCVVDVLKCDDPVVVNTLIDQRSVERTVLIEDGDEARSVMLKRPPKNAWECFTIEGDQILCRPASTFRYYSSDKTRARYLMADVAENVAAFQRELQALKAERDVLAKERAQQRADIERNLQEEKKCQTQINRLHDSINGLNFDIRELRNVEEPVPVDVTTLEEEVTGFKEKIEELKTRREAILQERETLEQALNTAKENYAQIEGGIRDKSDSGVQLREEISQAQAAIENAKEESKHYTTKLKEQERKIKEQQDEIDKYKKDLESDCAKAEEMCPRIETRRTESSVENEIHQIQRRIEEEEKAHGNEREITHTYTEKKQTLEKIQWEVQQLKTYVKKLEKAIERRQLKYMEMRKDIASRIKYYFIAQLFQRSFKGKMDFDFDRQTLDIRVNPSQGAVGGWEGKVAQAKDLKALSGGERSFSTVCFILSLWEAMESPFRCLDEFDVFMDMVNRRVSMEMMMETADMHKDMQFIFLTPQDMSNCRKIENVQIFRMPDPERTQKVLDFSQSQDVSFSSQGNSQR